MSVEILITRLDRDLPLPARAHPGDAGLDLYAAEDALLEPGERAAIGTGVAVAIPEGYAGFVLPRSGLAARHGIGKVNAPGLIDAGYRGEIRVLLINHDLREPFKVARGERIAQLVITPIPVVRLREVEVLPDSSRGAQGFGSSGR